MVEPKEHHIMDPEGNPCGGHTSNSGIEIEWQNGPLGRGPERKMPNGAMVEDVLDAAKGRLEFFQHSKFANFYNAIAIGLIDLAIQVLNMRTAEREIRGVEGLHQL